MAALVSTVLVLFGLQMLSVPTAAASVTTNGNDSGRSGWYPDEPGLSPSLVGSSGFGQKFAATVDGQVYAQPLVADNTLLVATETNKVYGLNPATGALIWSRSDLGAPFNPADVGCADLTPSIGITGTPVVDEATRSMYFLSKSYVSGSSGTPIWRMYAIDTVTGANKPHFPVVISGNADNDASRPFDAKHQMQRPGLLLMNGVVYAGFGAHCIALPYTGWVVGIDAASGVRKAMWSTEVGTGSKAGGIWQSGSGLVSDGPGQILVATGNGSTPTGPVPGHTPPGQLGLSVVRLTVQPGGKLKPTDFFAPYDSQVLDSGDMDLGSGGPLALPAQFGTADHPHLMVEAGKQGYVYLLDRDNLGGKGQGPSGGDGVIGRFGPDGGVWGKPTAWPGDGGWIYLTTVSAGTSAEAHTGELHAYKYGLTGAGQPTMTLTGRSTDYFGLSSSPPVVTSDGTTSGSALVWVVYAAGFDGRNAQLRAYLPVPDADGNMVLVNSWPIGTSSKFNQPAVDGGLVYVGTRDGKVLAFGQTVTVPVSATAVTWDPVPVGQAAVKTVTLTANTALKVNAISSTDSHFTVGAASPALGTTIAAGHTVNVPVTFTPTATGQVSGTLQVTTQVGVVKVALSAIGQSATAELSVAPSSISFGGVPVDERATRSVTFSNTGASTLTVNGASAPAAPFVVTGTDLPKTGQQVAPGASVVVPITFAPSGVGSFTGTLTVQTSGGTLSVPLSGSAAQAANLTLSDQKLDFGPVPVGSAVTQKFTLSNAGGLPLSLTRSKPPVDGQGFAATVGIGEGETLQPGETRTLTVKFAPTTKGPKTDQWQFNGGAGIQTVTFSGTGMAAGTVPAPTTGNGWVFNHTAKMVGSTLQLTGAADPNAAATAFWPVSVDSRFLDVSFDARMGGGSGADGLTLILGDSTHVTKNSVGAQGGGLGFGGLTGVAVGLDTYRNGDDPSDNFVGVATTKVNDPVNLQWAATTTSAPQLRGTPPVLHHVRALVTQGTLTVFLDGRQVLTTPVSLAARSLVGFGAGSGLLTDQHSVSNVVIRTVVPAVAPGAPTGVKAIPGNAAAKVSWTAPANNGGSAITGYRVTASPGGASASVAAGTSATITGLTNRTAYRFSVVARTAIGNSPVSAASAPVTPLLPVAVPPGASVSDAVLARPASGTAAMKFTISLSAPAATTVYVRYQTLNGAAKAGLDYRPVGSTVVAFAPGQTSRTVSVTVLGRALHTNATSDLHLRITAISAGLRISDGDGVGRLSATQGPLVVAVKDVVVQQGAAATSAVFTLSLSAAPITGESASVVVATANGSAVSPTDFTALRARTVKFPTGVRSVAVSVPVRPGVAKMANRSFALRLSAPSANTALARTSATATLRRAGSPAVPVGVAVSDAVATRPVSGTASMIFTLSLSAASKVPVSVRYQTVNGTARAGTDYRAIGSTLVTFAPGQTSRSVPVTLLGRGLHSVAVLGVHLRVTAATGASIADSDGVGRLMGGQGPVSLSVRDVVVKQRAGVSAAVFVLALSGTPVAGEPVSVRVATRNGSAVSPVDYTALAARTVTFNPGVRSMTVSIAASASVGAKPNRTFTLVLSAPSAVTALSRSQALATLQSQ